MKRNELRDQEIRDNYIKPTIWKRCLETISYSLDQRKYKVEDRDTRDDMDWSHGFKEIV